MGLSCQTQGAGTGCRQAPSASPPGKPGSALELCLAGCLLQLTSSSEPRARAPRSGHRLPRRTGDGQRPLTTPATLRCKEQQGGRLFPCSCYRSCWELRCLLRLANQDHISLRLAVSSSIIQQVARHRWLSFQGRAAPAPRVPRPCRPCSPLASTLEQSLCLTLQHWLAGRIS